MAARPLPRSLASALLSFGLTGLAVLAPVMGLAGGTAAHAEAAPLAAPMACTSNSSACLVLSNQNSYRPGSAAATAPIPRLATLRSQGYLVYAVKDLEVLNSLARHEPDSSLTRQRVGAGGFDAVSNGGFYFRSGDSLASAGAVMRRGRLDATGVPKASHRGGLARLEDGTAVIGQQRGSSATEIQSRFGVGSPVRDFMGGGALLIDEGRAVSSADLGRDASLGGQQFDQGGRGLYAQQMRRTHHTVLGIRDGQLFLIGARNKTGAEIQAQLLAAGFDSAIKFDGGSGSYLRTAGGTYFVNSHPFGFGFTLR